MRENKIQFIQHHADISTLSQKVEQKRYVLKTISGLNEEALGMAVNRQSGVAIAQRRDAGLMGLTQYIKRGEDMDRLLFERVLSLIQHYYTKEQTFRIVDKKTGERYFKINSDERNTITIGKFDLILQSTPKMQGREERFAHWAELLKTISSIRPDLLTDLLPFMLKDTDSPIVEDIEEVLVAKEQQAQAQAEAQAPIQEQAQALEIAKLESSVQKDQATASKLEAQAKMLQATTASLAKEQIAQATASNTNDNGEANPIKTLKGKMQISPSDIR